MDELLDNTWFVSIASSLLTLPIIFIGRIIVDALRARRGAFTGHYIAITTYRRSREKIVELVHCRHIGNNVKGKIYSVAIIQPNGNEQSVHENKCIYKFKGNVEERLMVASYHSVAKGDNSAGSLTLLGSTNGQLFSGTWGGLEDGRIISSDCCWRKSGKNLSRETDYDAIIALAKEPTISIIEGDGANGKSIVSVEK